MQPPPPATESSLSPRRTAKIWDAIAKDFGIRSLPYGVESPKCEVVPTNPVAYVLSLNSHRRHLTPSQLAMVAAKARGMYDDEAKNRQKLSKGQGVKGPANLPDLKSDARDAAGKALGVSGRSVEYATKGMKIDLGRQPLKKRAPQSLPIVC